MPEPITASEAEEFGRILAGCEVDVTRKRDAASLGSDEQRLLSHRLGRIQDLRQRLAPIAADVVAGLPWDEARQT